MPDQQAAKVQRVRLSDGRVVSLRGTEDEIAQAAELLEVEVANKKSADEAKADTEARRKTEADNRLYQLGGTGIRGEDGEIMDVPMMNRRVKTLTKVAPVVAGTMAGGWPGVAIAGGLGAAGQGVRDAIDDKPVSLGRMAGEGAIQGGLNAIAPTANAAAPLVKWLAKTGLSKLAGTSKVGAGRLLETGRAPFTRANAESVRSTVGQAGAPSEGTAVQFENAVARANRPVTTISNENPMVRFTPANDWQAVRLAKWANANKAKVGSYAAQGVQGAANKMEKLGGGPALVARIISQLMGGKE